MLCMTNGGVRKRSGVLAVNTIVRRLHEQIPAGQVRSFDSTHRLKFPVANTELFTLQGELFEFDTNVLPEPNPREGQSFAFDFRYGGLGDLGGEYSGANLVVGSFGVRFEAEPKDIDGTTIPIDIRAQVIVE